MALMVLVNDPGDGRHVYAPLEHARWNGWTPTDVVFPSFVWIVGVALTFSLARRMAAGASRLKLFRQALRRAAILFLLGSRSTPPLPSILPPSDCLECCSALPFVTSRR